MAGNITDDQVHLWLQGIADAAYVSLHFTTPALGGVGYNEISGGGYKRALTPFSQPANRTIWSLDDARFTGLLQNQLTHFGIWNTATGGLLVAYGELPTAVVITSGQGYILKGGDLAISFG